MEAGKGTVAGVHLLSGSDCVVLSLLRVSIVRAGTSGSSRSVSSVSASDSDKESILLSKGLLGRDSFLALESFVTR